MLDKLSLEGVEEFTAHIEPVVGDFPVAVQNSSATVSIMDNDGLLPYKHVHVHHNNIKQVVITIDRHSHSCCTWI